MLRLCPLASGSTGNCIYVSSQSTHILVDAGLYGKEIVNRLAQIGIKPNQIEAILISHEHVDHIRGARILSNKFNIPVYITEETAYYLGDSIANERMVRVMPVNGRIEINDIVIEPIPLPHDAIDPVGFCVHSDKTKISIATDLGHIPAYLGARFADSDGIFIESNHDEDMLMKGSYPLFLKERIMGSRGHISNSTAASFLAQYTGSRTQQIWLGHLSRNNNIPELAYETVKKSLTAAGFDLEHVTQVTCLKHGEMGRVVKIGSV